MMQPQHAIKRSLDVAVASLLLALAAPLMLSAALCVWWTMGTPILFRQKRPGLRGRPFTILKFRTMSEGTQPDAVRITKLGAFLRHTSLDELPELWNVIRGDMSLVGPRPLLMQYLNRYSPEQMRRHEVLPGITGLAQVNGRNALSWEERLTLDVWYVDHYDFWLDAKILLRSLALVWNQHGISHHQHATMPEFLGSAKPKQIQPSRLP
jgi:sugar transferase EpsL